MRKNERFKINRELILFFTTAFIISWILWIAAFIIEYYAINSPISADMLIRAGSFGPSVSGLILAYKSGGKKEVCALLKSVKNINIKPQWMMFAFLAMPAVSAISCLIYSSIGGDVPQTQFKIWQLPIAFLYIVLFMGPLGEEIGWRGFALGRMLNKFTPFKPAVIIGVIWTIWHLPLFFITGTTQNILAGFGIIAAFLCYMVYTVMISVLITLLYVKSSGSLFVSILFHAMGNMSLGIIPLILLKTGAVILLIVLSVLSIAVIYKYRKDMFMRVTELT